MSQPTPAAKVVGSFDTKDRGSLFRSALQRTKTWVGSASFGRDAAVSFSLNIFSAAISLITALMLARFIGAANYGVYAVALVYANVFAFVACLGFPQLIVRTEARRNTDDLEAPSQAAYETATFAASIAGVSLAIVGYALSGWIMPATPPESQWAFAIAMVMVVPMAYQRLREATLLGRHKAIFSMLPERVIRPTAMLVALLTLAYFVDKGLGANHAVAAQGFAYLLSIAGALYLIAITAPSSTRSSGNLFKPELLRDALPFLLVGLTTLLAGRVDIMMLAALTEAETVGQYRLAAQMAAIVMMITTVSQAVLSPKVSKLSHENKLQDLISALPRLGACLCLAAALLSLSVYFAFQLALPWIGSDFSEASPVLAILLTAFTCVAFFCPALPLLIMGGHAKYAAYANGIAIILNVTLNLILIPAFEGTGAAIATGISLVTLYGLYTYFAAYLSK